MKIDTHFGADIITKNCIKKAADTNRFRKLILLAPKWETEKRKPRGEEDRKK